MSRLRRRPPARITQKRTTASASTTRGTQTRAGRSRTARQRARRYRARTAPPRGRGRTRQRHAALQGRRERRSGAGPSRRGRNHLQPRNQPGALGRELAGPAVDREHHEGDDRDRLPREQSRPDAAGHDRAQRRVPGVDDAAAAERQGDDRRPAAPAADRVGQRRGAGARAHVAVRARSASSGA